MTAGGNDSQSLLAVTKRGFGVFIMKIDVAQIEMLLNREFAGNIIYQPVEVTPDMLVRPVAQMIPATRLLLSTSLQEDVSSFDRINSGMQMQGLLHHHAPPPAARKR